MKTMNFNLIEFGTRKRACAFALFCAVMAMAAHAQTFTPLVNFEVSNGDGPAPLVQGLDGKLYGVTWSGGSFGQGTVFRVTTQGSLKTIYSFCTVYYFCTDGANPTGSLTVGTNGVLYGATELGGNSNCGYGGTGCGEIFRVTAPGSLQNLHGFDISDGDSPSSVVMGSDGNFYGTTPTGGAYNQGTVFRITPSGQLTTIYNFCPKGNYNCGDGANPNALILGLDGALYGTTNLGGRGTCGNGYPCGTIFRITLTGKLTTLYAFPPGGLQGWSPFGSLIQTPDGSLYGSNFEGGIYGPYGGGTIFKLAPNGQFMTIYNFCSQLNCTDGSAGANFVLGTDGNFYGTTPEGGDLKCGAYGLYFGCGTIFSMTPSGTITTLHTFEGADGDNPEGLIQATDGNFYGVNLIGGDLSCSQGTGCGNVYRLSMGLAPFVKLLPAFGRVGQTVDILGQGFTGTSGVSLNGTPANFTVVSDTLIRVTIPAGATSGLVTVDTSGGTLTSNTVFNVRP